MIRSLAGATAGMALTAAFLGAQTQPFVPQVETTKLADGVYHIRSGADGYVSSMNMVVVINERDVLLFDTSTRPSTARVVLAEIRKLTDKPVRYVVNSHWHPDHWSGNEVYAEAFPGVEFVTTEQTKTYMLNMGNFFGVRFRDRVTQFDAAYKRLMETGRDEQGNVLTAQQKAEETAFIERYRGFAADLQRVRRTYPTLTYVDQLRLGRGDEEIVLMSVTGDAEGTTVMYLPKAKVLATGDAVSYPLPYTTPPPSRHARSLRRLAQLDVDMIVPGHGPVFRDKSFMMLEAEFLDAVVERVRASLRKGLYTVADVQKDVNLDDFRARFSRGDATLERNFAGFAAGVVRLAYLESRDNQEVRPSP